MAMTRSINAEAEDRAVAPKPDASLLFRLPWTAADNAMTWLEPTRRCNMVCDACFARNDASGDKPLDVIRTELEAMLRVRRCDALLVAGGEPLVHPHIVEVVRMVRDAGVKPVLVTNARALDPPLLRELKRAGARGFTFHVDSHQSRPGWEGCSELELNWLRQELADMVYAEGGMSCAFNVTVFPDTLAQVPGIVRWAVSAPDRVHILTLICVRVAEPEGPFRFLSQGRPVDLERSPYRGACGVSYLRTEDIYGAIREVLPGFEFCAYLGGTVHPGSLKWVLGCHLTAGGVSFGQLGARSMELIQNGYHALRGRFLACSSPKDMRRDKASTLLGVVDSETRKAAGRYFREIVKRPLRFFSPLYLQSISVVQPVDILPNGEMDTCDGCPNRTYWNGRLVPACRLEEYRSYGGPLQAVPRDVPG